MKCLSRAYIFIAAALLMLTINASPIPQESSLFTGTEKCDCVGCELTAAERAACDAQAHMQSLTSMVNTPSGTEASQSGRSLPVSDDTDPTAGDFIIIPRQ